MNARGGSARKSATWAIVLAPNVGTMASTVRAIGLASPIDDSALSSTAFWISLCGGSRSAPATAVSTFAA